MKLHVLAAMSFAWLWPAAAHSQACPGDYDGVFVEGGGEPAEVNEAVTLRAGVAHFRYHYPDCNAEREWQRGATLRVIAGSPGAELRALGEGRYEFQAAEAGVYLLGVSEPVPDGGYADRWSQTTTVLVAEGRVEFPVPRLRRRRAPWVFTPVHEHGVGVRAQPSGDGRLSLPRIPGWWAMPIADGELFLHVGDGVPTMARATTRLGLGPSALLAGTLEVRIQSEGTPTRTLECSGVCEAFVVPGTVRLEARLGGQSVSWALEVDGRTHDVRLSVSHLLAGVPQPAEVVPLRDLPRAQAEGERRRRSLGGPFAMGRRLMRIGPSLRERVGDEWVLRAARPRVYPAAATRTPVVVHDDVAYFAESTGRSLALYAADDDGFAQVRARVHRDNSGVCEVREVAVTSEAAVVVGGCAHRAEHPARDGFVVTIRDGVSTPLRTEREVRSVVVGPSGDVFVADGRDVLSCNARRCRRVRLRGAGAIVAVAIVDGSAVAIEDDGGVFDIRRRVPLPVSETEWDFPISRVITLENRLVALFGPVTTGSEYHPYCVASAVASLERGEWRALHVVAGDEGRLDCQDATGDSPVVMDIAVARGRLFARRRARGGATTGFAPLVEAGRRVEVAAPPRGPSPPRP